MQHWIDMWSAHKVMIVTVLFFLSELLALIPSVKANSIYQLIANALKKERDSEQAAQA